MNNFYCQLLNKLPGLHPTIYGKKVLPRSYGSISHLPGSKLIDERDTMLGEREVALLTFRRKDYRDRVIITEKVDGMNTGVLRIDDGLIPLTRKGYDVRTNPNAWAWMFALYVSNNTRRFMNVLNNGERMCGEWMIKTHTVFYNLNTEPYIVYDIINTNNERLLYDDFLKRINKESFISAGLVHIGESIDPKIALDIMAQGYHGASDQPEGVVYKYESFDKGFICSGKYVSHPNVGKEEYFMADEFIFNNMKKKYGIYIPSKEEKIND